MDQCTHEMRGNRWLQIIQACERRPTYQSKTEWLRENGVPESSYYNQLRRLRSELSTQIKQSLPLDRNLRRHHSVRVGLKGPFRVG